MKIKITILFFFACITVVAQTNGVVKDSVSGQPLPFVSIWVEHENIGMTSEEDGSFEIHTTANSKRLIFSSLGFENKTIDISKAAVVLLSPKAFALDEVVVQNRKETKTREIGQTNSSILEAFENGPRIDVKYFPYEQDYKKTKFIRKVSIRTDSQIDDASFKLHFYSVDENGFPGEELIKRDYIVSVTKGNKRTTFDIGKFNLVMPKCGLFVGFEKMMIEKNKIEKTITDKDTNTSRIKKSYAPMMLYNRVERDFTMTFSAGKWNVEGQYDPTGKADKKMVYEPAINLILTN